MKFGKKKAFYLKIIGKKINSMEFSGSVIISKGASTPSFDLCQMGRARQHSFGLEDKTSKH